MYMSTQNLVISFTKREGKSRKVKGKRGKIEEGAGDTCVRRRVGA
jgi:hypothetical protein